jgi:hypothetical protein
MTDGIARPQVALTPALVEHQKRKKLQKIWHIFWLLKNVVHQHHVSHTIHHTHTTKAPHQSLTFFSKSPQKIMFHHAQKNKKTAPQNHKETETIHLLQSANP